METHENIKFLREKLGLSQEELAIKVGYKDRSSIAKVEAGLVDLPQSKIAAFAAALHVAPVELMGITDSNPVQLRTSQALSTYSPLSSDEEDLIRKYRCLDDRGKSAVLNVLNHEYDSLPGEKANPLTKEA